MKHLKSINEVFLFNKPDDIQQLIKKIESKYPQVKYTHTGLDSRSGYELRWENDYTFEIDNIKYHFYNQHSFDPSRPITDDADANEDDYKLTANGKEITGKNKSFKKLVNILNTVKDSDEKNENSLIRKDLHKILSKKKAFGKPNDTDIINGIIGLYKTIDEITKNDVELENNGSISKFSFTIKEIPILVGYVWKIAERYHYAYVDGIKMEARDAVLENLYNIISKIYDEN